jgi:hypothetical protein
MGKCCEARDAMIGRQGFIVMLIYRKFPGSSCPSLSIVPPKDNRVHTFLLNTCRSCSPDTGSVAIMSTTVKLDLQPLRPEVGCNRAAVDPAKNRTSPTPLHRRSKTSSTDTLMLGRRSLRQWSEFETVRRRIVVRFLNPAHG